VPKPTSRIFARETGGGRVVYFPWDIDGSSGGSLVDHWKLLEQRCRLGGDEPRPVQIEGPGILDLALWRQKDSAHSHMVKNLTNPRMMKGPAPRIHSAAGRNNRSHRAAGRRAAPSSNSCWSAAKRPRAGNRRPASLSPSRRFSITKTWRWICKLRRQGSTGHSRHGCPIVRALPLMIDRARLRASPAIAAQSPVPRITGWQVESRIGHAIGGATPGHRA